MKKRKKRTTLNIKEGLVEEAKSRGLNISKIAEGALQKALENEPLYPTQSDDTIPIVLPQRREIPRYKFATMTDEEWNEMLEEELREYRRMLEQHREVHKNRQRIYRLETAFRIESRYKRYPFYNTPKVCYYSVKELKARLATETNPKKLEDTIEELTESKRIWEEIRHKIETGEMLKKWLKETESSRRILTSPHPSEEDMTERFEEDRLMITLALPHLEEIIQLYQNRLDEIKEALFKAEPLVKKANEIRNQAIKPVEDESKLIDAMCEADSFGREKELNELLAHYRKLKPKIDQLEDEHRKICGEIHHLRIAPSDLLSFPPRKLERLKFHDRIWRKL